MNLPGRRWAILAALLTIVLAAGALRFGSLQFGPDQMDEFIAVRVSQRMVAEGSLDTNWKLADLPGFFRYPQYNFSGYLLFSAGAVAASGSAATDLSALGALRWWSALLGMLVVAQTFALGRTLFGAVPGLIASAFAACALLLYQDSLYARPEPFVTVLALLYVQVLLAGGIPRRPRLAAAALLLGFLVGTKVSLAALAPLLLLAGRRTPGGASFLAWARQELVARLAPPLATLGLLLLFAGLGFAIAAPHALLNPGDYLAGIRALVAQYAGGHWPHGLPEGSLAERLGYALRYFAATLGVPMLLAMALGVADCLRRRDWDALLVAAVAAVAACRFGTYATFFERNFSHLLPLGLAFAGAGLVALARWLPARALVQRLVLAAAFAVALVPALRSTASLRFVELPGVHLAELRQARRAVEQGTGMTAKVLPPTEGYAALRRQLSACGPELVELAHMGDALSDGAVAALVQRDGFQVVGGVPSPFEHVPPSTLHTYFLPGKLFLARAADPARCAGATPGGPNRR